MTYRRLLRTGEAALREAGIEEAESDARILFEHVTGIDRTHFFLRDGEECPGGQRERYETLIARRCARIPVQYLTGVQEFMGMPFAVSEQVLIPRQDTELLVLEAERRIRPDDRVLDLCTGSGCIIISLKKRCQIRAFASDISERALAVAEANADRLGADVQFIQSDLFAGVPGKFDVIVSNPPYIASREISRLMPEVGVHEPRAALDGGADGLDFYRRIIPQAAGRLHSGGRLLLEIGCTQGAAAAELMRQAGYQEIVIKKDLAGLDRVVGGIYV